MLFWASSSGIIVLDVTEAARRFEPFRPKISVPPVPTFRSDTATSEGTAGKSVAWRLTSPGGPDAENVLHAGGGIAGVPTARRGGGRERGSQAHRRGARSCRH